MFNPKQPAGRRGRMTTTTKKATIVWQSSTYEDVNEMPLVIAKYHGAVCIEQEDRTICIADEHLEEVIKALRKVRKEIL